MESEKENLVATLEEVVEKIEKIKWDKDEPLFGKLCRIFFRLEWLITEVDEEALYFGGKMDGKPTRRLECNICGQPTERLSPLFEAGICEECMLRSILVGRGKALAEESVLEEKV
jgi:hypothetical protein